MLRSSSRNGSSDDSQCRPRRRDVRSDAVPNARVGCLHGFIGQVRIACRGLNLGVTEELPDHGEALSGGQGAGRKGVAQSMEPESRPARRADARIEILDGFEMARSARLRRKHPAPRLPGELFPLGEPALQDGGELAVTGNSSGSPLLVSSMRMVMDAMSTCVEASAITSVRRMPV